MIAEYEGDTMTAKYIHGPGTDEPWALITRKGTYYYHADGLGSIVAITDGSMRTVQEYEYDFFGNGAFGGLHDMKNRIKQPYTFTGREFDRDTRLYYYRARYYDPSTGRFTQQDPIGYDGGLNLYAYVGGNPVNAVDPWGLRVYYHGETVNTAMRVQLIGLSAYSGYDIHLVRRGGTRNGPNDSTTSQHYTGNAADFYMSTEAGVMLDMAEAAYLTADYDRFRGIGYYNGQGGFGAHVHADLRNRDTTLYWSVTDATGYHYGLDSEFWSTYLYLRWSQCE